MYLDRVKIVFSNKISLQTVYCIHIYFTSKQNIKQQQQIIILRDRSIYICRHKPYIVISLLCLFGCLLVLIDRINIILYQN